MSNSARPEDGVKRFKIGKNIDATVTQRETEAGQEAHIELRHTVQGPDGTARTQEVTWPLDRFERLLDRADEVLRERQRAPGRDGPPRRLTIDEIERLPDAEFDALPE